MSGPWDKYAQPTAPVAPAPLAPAAGDPVIAPPDPWKLQNQQNENTRTSIAVQQNQRETAQNTWTTMTPEEVAKAGLPVGPMYQRSGTGEIKAVGDVKGSANPAQTALNTVKSIGIDLTDPNDRVAQLINESTSGKLQEIGASAYGAVTGNATPGMEKIGKLQTIVSDLTMQATGGGLGNQISDADRNFIVQRMGDIANPDVPGNQRLAAWQEVKGRLARALGVQLPQAQAAGQQQSSDRHNDGGMLMVDGQQVYDGNGNPVGPDFTGEGFDKSGNSMGQFGRADGPTAQQLTVQKEADRLDKVLGPAGYGDLAQHGLTLGLTDEASGIGRAVGRLLKGDTNIAQNYALGRDAEQLRLEQARQMLGIGGQAAELAGNFALPANALASGVGAAAKAGAVAGGVGGFGYGRGYDQSTQNALIGAVGGAALGYGGQRIGNALASRAASDVPERAVALSQAGQAEGVTVNRAMVDPRLQNRVTGVDATISGGPKIQGGMKQIEGQIGSRVQDLGAGGKAMETPIAGQMVERAGKRFIETSGKAAAVKYDRAEKLAGDIKVEPKESMQAVDSMIASLSETPGQNSAEIGFLNTLKSDLSNNLSVGALRRMRTALRSRIRTGGLTFGEDEGRILGIMDAAANDIRNGLAAQGNEKAANAFDAADKAYRARMEYINGTLQKVLGNRNANLPAEKMWQRFQAMASDKGDSVGLRKFYATLTPSERSDVAATFASDLGKDNAGEFSVAHFLNQSEKLSDDAKRMIFGADGAESIRNLQLLGKEVKRVTSAMNSRTSKTGVANNYKDWLLNLMLGGIAGGGGGMAGGSSAAMAGAGAAVGLNAVRNVLTARSLMSPKLTRWLLQAPATAAPAAINRHFERLGEIAKAEPALAGEIDSIRRAIMGAANDNVGVSAAASDRKKEQQQQ